MTILEATRAYEKWAHERIPLIPRDLRLKHRCMAEAVFPFLRATFYRWSGVWPEACAELVAAPRVLAVGDLHVENFGTWRDREGRLAWGVNDLDEAHPLPYTHDLVRLAASAYLAIREESLSIDAEQAADAILAGYEEAIAGGGHAYVLEEHHPALRALAYAEERAPEVFWQKLTVLDRVPAPRAVETILRRALPADGTRPKIVHRVAGLGSLGRQRFLALAEAEGSLVAREAKAMLPSACVWATGARGTAIATQRLAQGAIRSPDPFYAVEKGWLLRRIGPHCSRIELAHFPKRADERRILQAMGRETANVHFASADAIPAIKRDLRRRGRKWLRRAAGTMADAVLRDWKAWRKAQ